MNDLNSHPDPDQIQAFFDQILDPGTARDLQAHLEGCPDCRAALERLENLACQLSALPEFTLSRDLSREVLAHLRESQQLSPGIGWTLGLETLAAGILIGVLLPIIRAAAWWTDLAGAPRELLVQGNIILTQLASSWMIWWARLELDLTRSLQAFKIPVNLAAWLPSPWILVLAAGAAALLINFLLLRGLSFNNQSQQA